MTKILLKTLALVALISVSASASAQNIVGSFNWNQPGTLNPAHNAPTSDDRYGEYISEEVFSDNGVTFVVDDSGVKELSRKARFLFNYTTQACEMRAYQDSYITITAPEDYDITSIHFEGPKVGSSYLTAEDETLGKVGESDWIAADGASANQVVLYVEATINCTLTQVNCVKSAGVQSVTVDANTAQPEYYTLTGQRVVNPVSGSLYVVRQGANVTKQLIK